MNFKNFLGVEKQGQPNPVDKVTLDIPLMIRLLEYAREDAKTDMDLHNVAENAINLSHNGQALTMSDYETLISNVSSKPESIVIVNQE